MYVFFRSWFIKAFSFLCEISLCKLFCFQIVVIVGYVVITLTELKDVGSKSKSKEKGIIIKEIDIIIFILKSKILGWGKMEVN